VTNALKTHEKGPSHQLLAVAEFVAGFREAAGMPELVNCFTVAGLNIAALQDRDQFAALMTGMVNEAVAQPTFDQSGGEVLLW